MTNSLVASCRTDRAGVEGLRASFTRCLPAIRRAAGRSFPRVRCPHARADLVAEAVALCWAWAVAGGGADATEPTLARMARAAAAAVQAGGRLAFAS